MQVLAIDLGGTHATCAVVRDREVLAREVLDCGEAPLLAPMLPRFAQSLRNLCSSAGLQVEESAGVALGFCGLADFAAGRVLSTNLKYEDAPNLDLLCWARTEFGLPLLIENDARMALLGERAAGSARGYDDIVMMTLGTGIGGAAMMQGRLVRGKHAQAGCLGGHLIVSPQGRRCTCGAVGCAESEASTWALPAVCAEWPGFAASALACERTLDFAALFRVAGAGDEVAQAVAEHCIQVWAALAVSLVHAYDPEVVVIGGGVMRSAAKILPGIRKHVQDTAWTPWGKVKVVATQCGDDAALLGAIPLFAEAAR